MCDDLDLPRPCGGDPSNGPCSDALRRVTAMCTPNRQAIEARQALLAVLAQDCDQPDRKSVV